MLRIRLMTGVVVLVLLGALWAIGGYTADLEQLAKETNTFTIQGRVTVDAYHYDEATGTYIHFYHDESSNLVVDIGLEWIEDQLGDSASATTDTARYISLSEDTGTPAVGWTQIPAEITTNGLDRQTGTFDGTIGVGQWEIENTFTAGASFTAVQLTGLQWSDTDASDNNLMAANTFISPVSLSSGDTLKVTWTLTLS